MDTQRTGPARQVIKRGVAALLVAAGLGGCVYAPPYAYGPNYPGYSYPTYVGPPISVDLGFGYVEHRHHGHYGHHGHHGHHGGHHRGWGHGRGHGWGRR